MKRKSDLELIAEIKNMKDNFDKAHGMQSAGREKFLAAPENKAEVERAKLALDVAEKLCKARRRAGLTQSGLAGKIHSSQASVARIEKGANVSIFTIAAYADACGKQVKINFV